MGKLYAAGVEKQETVEDLVDSLVLSELDLLTIDLTLLLSLVNKFVLILQLRSFSSYLHHLIQISDLHRKRLLLLYHRPLTWLSALLPIIRRLQHLITPRYLIALLLRHGLHLMTLELTCTLIIVYHLTHLSTRPSFRPMQAWAGIPDASSCASHCRTNGGYILLSHWTAISLRVVRGIVCTCTSLGDVRVS